MSLLLFKTLCTPVLIWVSAFIARRWGTFVGGCFAGLPVISGPVSLCIALEQGVEFAAMSAHSALFGVGAVSLFTLAYAWMALKYTWVIALMVAQATYFFASWGASFLPHSAALAMLVGVVGAPAALLGMPRFRSQEMPMPRRQYPWMVPLQMVLGAVLVLGISSMAPFLGVYWSGIFTFYPVMISILAPFVMQNMERMQQYVCFQDLWQVLLVGLLLWLLWLFL